MLRVLDCTLRDGGYYNDWDFDHEVVKKYLSAMADSGVDMVELGLRNFSATNFKGPYFYSSENYLNDLKLPTGPEYGVMVDAKTILQASKAVGEAVEDLFVRSKISNLSFVRVACHFMEVEASEEIVKHIASLGYRVYVNLMQISIQSDEDISNTVQLIAGWPDLAGVYFADSLGNMSVPDVTKVINLVRNHWSGELGIHTHNNMGAALTNALAAANLGVNIIDSTLTGMGRGAGNAETEMLLAELEASKGSGYKVGPLADIVLSYFEPLKHKLGWGPSLHYYIAAKYGIHPTYIQKILTDQRFSLVEKVDAVKNLPKLAGKSSFDERYLSDFLSSSTQSSNFKVRWKKNISSFDTKGAQSAILIGSGPQVERHIKAVKNFVDAEHAQVFAINSGIEDLAPVIDAYFVSHNTKKIEFSDFFKNRDSYVVAPVSRFKCEELEHANHDKVFDFSVSISPGVFTTNLEGCSVPFDLTAAYAIAAIISLKFGKIYLIGFDGYGFADVRQKEMSELFHLARKEYPTVQIIALTPTTYPVEQGSIYAPILGI